MRELACLRAQYPFILQPMHKGDLFAGRIFHAPVGFSPQMGDGFGYYIKADEFRQLLNDESLSADQKQRAQDILKFWSQENSACKTRRAYPDHLQAMLSSDNWTGEPGIAFPLYRMAGSNLDYRTLVHLGIPGLRDKIVAAQTTSSAGAQSMKLYAAMHLALELLRDVCLWYAEMADVMAGQAAAKEDVAAFNRCADSLNHIAYFAPESLHHSLQLFWLYALLSGNVDYGRIDIWATAAFERDRDENNLSDEEALQMLLSLWRLISEREQGVWIYDSRVIIGGKGRENETVADDLALLCIEATRRRHDIMPQLSLRFYDGQNPKLYKTALGCISENNPYPMLYNDDVNIPSVANAFQVSEQEAVNYLPYGCGEYILERLSFGTPSGVINVLQALLVTLHQGVEPMSGKRTPAPENIFFRYRTFDELFYAYKRLVELNVKALAEQEALEYKIAAQTAPFLFFSLLYDDCIERGKAIFDGGVKYLGGTLESYGNSNAADSLLAIKKLVYEEQRFTLERMVAILDADFKGSEAERKQMLEAPKYGNDDNEADAMLVEVDSHLFHAAREQAAAVGLHSYLIVLINNSANTILGRFTAASPDGRRAKTPMNNGNAPSSGMDKNGVTAFLNSIVKPPTNVHAGAVQNMKFSKELFIQHREQVNALLDVYWEKGGAQAMLTVLGRGDLENAMAHPENYQTLIVRVGGYSARFVELERDIQQEILQRTLY